MSLSDEFEIFFLSFFFFNSSECSNVKKIADPLPDGNEIRQVVGDTVDYSIFVISELKKRDSSGVGIGGQILSIGETLA